MNRTVNDQIQSLIQCEGVDKGSLSDGFHTFDELYEHRTILYIALCKKMWGMQPFTSYIVWRTRVHSDGTMFDGWFLLGINREEGKQITYHLPDKYWDDCHFAATLSKAPTFDGHTPKDVLKRLKTL